MAHVSYVCPTHRGTAPMMFPKNLSVYSMPELYCFIVYLITSVFIAFTSIPRFITTVKNIVRYMILHVMVYCCCCCWHLGTDLDPSAIGLVDSAGPEDKQAFLVTCFKANHRLHVRKSRSLRGQRHRRSPAPTSYYSDEKDYRWRYPCKYFVYEIVISIIYTRFYNQVLDE